MLRSIVLLALLIAPLFLQVPSFQELGVKVVEQVRADSEDGATIVLLETPMAGSASDEHTRRIAALATEAGTETGVLRGVTSCPSPDSALRECSLTDPTAIVLRFGVPEIEGETAVLGITSFFDADRGIGMSNAAAVFVYDPDRGEWTFREWRRGATT